MPARQQAAPLRAWRAFLEAHAGMVAVLERELAQGGHVPLGWYDVLVQLSENGGRLRMQELARSVLLSKSGLTRLVDRMETAGLVRREPCEDDARGTLAAITSSGRAALRRATPVHLRGIEKHFNSRLSEAETRAIISGLGKVVDNLPPR